MAVHGFIPDATLDDVVAAVTAACKAKALRLTVELASCDDGVELKLRDATPTHVEALAQSLGASHARVEFADCEIAPGSRGVQLTAGGLSVNGGTLRHSELDRAAREILYEWSDGGPVHEEDVVSELLAAALLDRDPDGFHPAKVLRFATKRGSRLDELVAALRAGVRFEWTQVGDQPALRLDDGSGMRRVAVVSASEAETLREVIEALPHRDP